MKLLQGDELAGIDSTSATIAKWDEFLKRAVWNMGYKQELIDNMYPYDRGIPMSDGTFMPVSQKTGRVFFKMSWADKLCLILALCSAGNRGNNSPDIRGVKIILQELWKSSYKNFKAFFHDKTEEDWTAFTQNSELFQEYFNTFIDASKIYLCPTYEWDTLEGLPKTNFCGELSEAEKEEIKDPEANTFIPSSRQTSGHYALSYYPIIYCSLVADEFSPLDGCVILSAFKEIGGTLHYTQAQSTFSCYSEVFLQDYLVISLNPIDKMMCSTKQAFSSCMSFAKQKDTRGTSSVHAFGLPALFPSDTSFLIFMTPGKHKNMYWESSEWVKSPEERDKSKAYKYLKMTCRALTYQGYTYRRKEKKSALSKLENSEDLLNKLHLDNTRLYIGRQYASYGECVSWQIIMMYLLSFQGISTPASYANAAVEAYDAAVEAYHAAEEYSLFSPYNDIIRGELYKKDIVAIDRFGFIRGIYFDNIRIRWAEEAAQGTYQDVTDLSVSVEDLVKDAPRIKVSSTREGSGGVQRLHTSSFLDAFKLFSGKQKYNALNVKVHLCKYCGELVPADVPINPDGSYICEKCMEEKHITRCTACGQLYSRDIPKEASEHECFNIMELLYPDDYAQRTPVLLCRAQLKEADDRFDTGRSAAICSHCGEILNSAITIQRNGKLYGCPGKAARGETQKVPFYDFIVNVVICDECLQKAVMCDRCHRLLFLDDLKDACLLLPNRRVVCPDCVSDIRMKQEKRKVYKEVLDRLTAEDVESVDGVKLLIQDVVTRQASDSYFETRKSTLIKDVERQIRSYIQAHGEYPKSRVNTPVKLEEV